MSRTPEQNRQYMREYRARRKTAAKATPQAGVTPKVETAPSISPPTSRHSRAVEEMVEASGIGARPIERPLLELVRVLAADLDAGGDGSTVAQYRAALGDLRRVLAGPTRKPVTGQSVVLSDDEADEAVEAAPTDDLARFKAARGIA